MVLGLTKVGQIIAAVGISIPSLPPNCFKKLLCSNWKIFRAIPIINSTTLAKGIFLLRIQSDSLLRNFSFKLSENILPLILNNKLELVFFHKVIIIGSGSNIINKIALESDFWDFILNPGFPSYQGNFLWKSYPHFLKTKHFP